MKMFKVRKSAVQLGAIVSVLMGATSWAQSADARDRSKPMKTPRSGWERFDIQQGDTSTDIRREGYPIYIRSTVLDSEPGDEDIARIVKRATGTDQYSVISVIQPEILKKEELSLGMRIKTGTGKTAIYYSLIRKRKDGRFAVTSMLTMHLALASENEKQREAKREENAAHLKLLEPLNNQLIRGAVAGYFVKPRIEYAAVEPASDVLFSKPNATEEKTNPAEVEKDSVNLAKKTESTPLPGTGVAMPSNTATNTALTIPKTSPTNTASVGTSYRYPFMVKDNSGVGLSQVSAIIYAPLEFSEVYVLFKDGSFHENMPVALEDWDVGASKKGDPESWGKWKPAKKTESGGLDFDLRYAGEDDVVKITGTKIDPVSPGTLLEGTYVVDAANMGTGTQQKPDKNAITFTGERFAFEDKSLGEGTYKVQGYTITLMYNNGRAEHRPFFLVPKDEDEDDDEQEQAIWFGDEIKVKV
jgi:hypothetical protein